MKHILPLLLFAFFAMAAAAQNVVTELPATAVAADYSMDGTVFYVPAFSSSTTQDKTTASVARWAFDGDDAYLLNPISQLPTETWIRGRRDGDRITMPMPQCIKDANGLTFYVDRLVFGSDDGGDYGTFVVDTDSRDIVYTIAEDGTITMDETGYPILGVTIGDEWQGYGDAFSTFTPFTDEPVSLPEGIQTEDWTCLADGKTHNVRVATDGTDIYVQGVFQDALPEAWVKGSVDGNVVTFPTGQYLGVYNNHYLYMRACLIEFTYNTTYGFNQVTAMGELEDGLQCAYSASLGRLLAEEQGFVSTMGLTGLNFFEYVYSPLMSRIEEDFTPTSPMTPEILTLVPYSDDERYGYFSFNLSPYDTAYHPLAEERLFYNVYLDGQKYTLPAGEYVYLTEDLTDIPYGQHDGYDIWADGIFHAVYFHKPVSSVGVTLSYRHTDGNVYTSEMDMLVDAGIEELQADRQATGPCYDLSGRRIAKPGKGVYIRGGKKIIVSD